VLFVIDVLEKHLSEHAWIAGETYSLGDIGGFNMAYALPLTQPERCNDQRTPHIMEWLRKIWERPAAKQTWAKGRTTLASRIKILDRG
jgi:GST-like protein